MTWVRSTGEKSSVVKAEKEEDRVSFLYLYLCSEYERVRDRVKDILR
jgi:hypothetical protein